MKMLILSTVIMLLPHSEAILDNLKKVIGLVNGERYLCFIVILIFAWFYWVLN